MAIHRHHIIPKSRQGTDNPSNIVELTPYEHALVHAFDFLEGGPWFDNRHEAWPLLPEYLREEVRAEQSIRMTGERHPLHGKKGKDHPRFGKPHTPEHRQLMSEKMRGDNNPMFGKPGARLGKTHTEESKLKIREARSRQTITEHTRQKMSETRQNNVNARYKQRWWVNENNERMRSSESPGLGWQSGMKWRMEP
jgi:hypothetical protein